MSAAMMAVMVPMTMTTVRAGVPTTASKSGKVRATRYTPAATMVAAWMRALTGVGPAMASGSQTCSGNWALLPTAPPKIRQAAMTIRVGLPCGQLLALFKQMHKVQHAGLGVEQHEAEAGN